MPDTAERRFTIAAFLAWSPGGDTRYELLDGLPVAMAPPSAAHQIVAGNLARRIGEALDRRPPCTVRSEAGVTSPTRADTRYQADLAVTCRPHAIGQYDIPDPVLIVEVLSPLTEDHERKRKLPDYRAIASVREIVLIDPARLYCEIHRRCDGERWLTDLLLHPDSRLRLDSVGLDLPLATVYANVTLEPLPEAEA